MRWTDTRAWVAHVRIPAPQPTLPPEPHAGLPTPVTKHDEHEFVPIANALLTRKHRDAFNKRMNLLAQGEFRASTNARTGAPWLTWVPADNASAALFATHGSDAGIQACLRNRNVFLVGTSYQRVLFWDLVRALGHPVSVFTKLVSHSGYAVTDHQSNCSLARRPPSATPDEWTPHHVEGDAAPGVPTRLCFFSQNQSSCIYQNGLPGLDPATCGVPGSREEYVPRLNATIRFQMKTYLRTPLVDELVRHQLATRKWDAVITAGGEWGRAGARSDAFLPGVSSTPHDALARAFFKFAIEDGGAFSDAESAPLVLHRCQDHGFKDSTRAMCVVASRDARLLFFYDKYLMRRLRDHDRSFRKAHGFEGPLTDASMRVIMAGMCAPLAL